MSEKLLYTSTDLPVLQNRLYLSVEAARQSPTGDVHLVQNQETGLVYNASFQSKLVNYDPDYNNDQTTSGVFRTHMESVANLIGKYIGKDRLVEVGCGKGVFLEMLLKRGFDVTGFDPTYEGNNPNIQKTLFDKSMNLKGRGLILRHVLEHIQDPLQFLQQIREANQNQGLVYIEVPCLEWILANKAWFDIFYEHVNYFRLGDFYSMFDKVVDAGHFFGGQYLYVIAHLDSLKMPVFNIADSVKIPDDFDKAISQFSESSKGAIVWGAGSKGVIFSLHLSRSGASVEYVIDIDKEKQGLYMPVTGYQVSSPDILENLDVSRTIYVMNSNYIDEIRDSTKNKFRYQGIENG